MSDECAKACKRRSTIPAFTEHYMAGKAIDIGAGQDGLSKHQHLFPLITSVRDWDQPDGDANEMPGVPDESYDLVHSSHCLEHMKYPWKALHRWWEILRPNGHLVVVIPEFWRYEQPYDWRQFPPSRYNPDHKTGFTMRFNSLFQSQAKNIRYLPELLATLPDGEIQRMELLDWTLPKDRSQKRDYSSGPAEEPSIEFVVRKLSA